MSNLPYVTAAGNVDKALRAIEAAATPEVVSGNFVKTILKIPGGSGDQMTSFLKKIAFANPDGSPTDIYKRFRNEATQGRAAAESLKIGYAALYKRNEYLHELPDKDLKGHILEETGLASDSKVPGYILACIKALKKFSDFDAGFEEVSAVSDLRNMEKVVGVENHADNDEKRPASVDSKIGFSVGYNINLNLPATNDISVFNAIFKSLKENLLSDKDE